jgi:hypothetical protein
MNSIQVNKIKQKEEFQKQLKDFIEDEEFKKRCRLDMIKANNIAL